MGSSPTASVYIYGLIDDSYMGGSNLAARVAVCKTVTKKHRRFESYLPHFGKLAQLVEH